MEKTMVDPRRSENLGIMVCSHKRYKLGDEQLNMNEFKSWDEVEKWLEEERGAMVMLPLWLYFYEGRIYIRTYPCGKYKGDGKQIGLIYTTSERIEKEFGEATWREFGMVRYRLADEVAKYDDYLQWG